MKRKHRDIFDSFYVLDGKTPRHAANAEEWAQGFEMEKRRVAETETDFYCVSTVFLAVAHGGHRNGPPMLFETMVFTSPEYAALVSGSESLDHATTRYASWDDATAGHATQVRRLERQIQLLLTAKPGGTSSVAEKAASEQE